MFDNVFVERLWRTVKYEEVYLKNYDSQVDAHAQLESYFRFCYERRPHQANDGGASGAAYSAGNRRPSTNDRLRRWASNCASLSAPVLGSDQCACPADEYYI